MSRPKITYKLTIHPSIRWIDIDRAPKTESTQQHSDLSLYNPVTPNSNERNRSPRPYGDGNASTRFDMIFVWHGDATADAFQPHWYAIPYWRTGWQWYDIIRDTYSITASVVHRIETDRQTTRQRSDRQIGCQRRRSNRYVATGSIGAFNLITNLPASDGGFERPGRLSHRAVRRCIWQIRLRFGCCGLCCGESVVLSPSRGNGIA